jgi:Flp pilus assembly protein TadD
MVSALIHLHDFKRALGIAQLEISIAPQRSDAWMDLAYVYDVQHLPAQALHAFKQALRFDPGNDYARAQVQRIRNAH